MPACDVCGWYSSDPFTLFRHRAAHITEKALRFAKSEGSGIDDAVHDRFTGRRRAADAATGNVERAVADRFQTPMRGREILATKDDFMDLRREVLKVINPIISPKGSDDKWPSSSNVGSAFKRPAKARVDSSTRSVGSSVRNIGTLKAGDDDDDTPKLAGEDADPIGDAVQAASAVLPAVLALQNAENPSRELKPLDDDDESQEQGSSTAKSDSNPAFDRLHNATQTSGIAPDSTSSDGGFGAWTSLKCNRCERRFAAADQAGFSRHLIDHARAELEANMKNPPSFAEVKGLIVDTAARRGEIVSMQEALGLMKSEEERPPALDKAAARWRKTRRSSR